jgi:broad specificity phosphatase PhoE
MLGDELASSMATRFTWICHASTATARLGAFPGDEAIDEKGAAQAAAATGSIAKPERVWRSPMLCARQTAEALGLAGVVEPALKECDYGRWSGRTLKEIHSQEPGDLETWIHDPTSSPHGGETIIDLIRRVAAWIDDHRRDAGHTVVITHSSVIRAAIIHVIQASPSSFNRIDIAPLSRTIISAHDGQLRLASMGCLDV